MCDNGFKEGNIDYKVASGVTPAALADTVKGSWEDGFVAFANGEKRLGDISEIPLDAVFFAQKINGRLDQKIEGYVAELNLWRKEESLMLEISAEREENTFFVQSWKLDTAPAPGTGNCWYREAATRTGSHHKDGRRIFSDELKTIEVVWPEKRLNFFITRGDQ